MEYEKSIQIKYCEAIKELNSNWSGQIIGNTEDELVINWNGEEEISVADIKAKVKEMETAEENEKQTKINLKASAKAKLIAGEPLTEEEADTIVL
tara:strand:- start:1500 stop:1784 length:285 start_codon:yes stop_codon:yes gene_type:complete